VSPLGLWKTKENLIMEEVAGGPSAQPPVPPGTEELARLRSLRQQHASATGRLAAIDTEIEYHAHLLAGLHTDRSYWTEVQAKLRGAVLHAEQVLDAIHDAYPSSSPDFV
jgi:hypothetical protein